MMCDNEESPLTNAVVGFLIMCVVATPVTLLFMWTDLSTQLGDNKYILEQLQRDHQQRQLVQQPTPQEQCVTEETKVGFYHSTERTCQVYGTTN